MAKGENKIWIGFRADGSDVEASTSLKGLCEEIGASYNTAVSKNNGSRFVLWAKNGPDEAMWYVQEKRLNKIKGRGRF